MRKYPPRLIQLMAKFYDLPTYKVGEHIYIYRRRMADTGDVDWGMMDSDS